MTSIVRNMTSLVVGFVILFGLYVAVTGHTGPGGGFAGALIITAGVVLVILAYGGDAAREITAEWRCQLAQALGGLTLLAIALLGFKAGGFLAYFLPPGHAHEFLAACDLAITVQVAAGMAGIFLALVVATRRAMPGSDLAEGLTEDAEALASAGGKES
jgi:multicomponent Na+:H+ antiporter subunit B